MTISPFATRGVIEGFYGVFYTFPERDDLIRFIGAHDFNLYIYGPKNDRQHRVRWWEPYPAEVMDEFARTVALAREVGVTFCYAIAFGESLTYSSPDDFARLTAKFRAFYDRGVRAFSVLLDDLDGPRDGFAHEVDRQRYGTPAAAHADVCNRLAAWLWRLDPACTLTVCPSDYHGVAPFSAYLHELGARLQPAIDLCYTGPEICSPEIGAADVRDFAMAVGRAPIVWDNYPVNDLAMKEELHLGPITGRDAALGEVCKGIVVNLMVQPEASKIALLTWADYLADPRAYDPWRSWDEALRVVGGAGSFAHLRRFAETALHSCLGAADAPTLTRLTRAVLVAAERNGEGWPREEAAALNRYVDELDESCYHLKNRMRNLALRDDLLPWIGALEGWLWMARRALLLLEAVASGGNADRPRRLVDSSLDEMRRCAWRSGGNALLPLAQFAHRRAESTCTRAAETA